MLSVIIRRDPFRPNYRPEAVAVRSGTRLDTVLRRQGFVVGRGRALRRPVPFVVQVNGDWLVADRWARRLRDSDVVVVQVLPGFGGGSNPMQMVAMVALAVATAGVGALAAGAYAGAMGVAVTSAGAMAIGAGAAAAFAIVGGMAINSIFPPAKPPAAMQREQASPTYTIGAQGNMARPFESIPVRYGRHRFFPDFASQPYTEMQGNETYLYQLFCIGQGEYDIEQIRIENTPIENFGEVRYEVVRPGQRVTMFPDNVVTSEAVQGISLGASGSPEGGPVGPHPANPPGTRITEIAVDITLPRGLFFVANNNSNQEYDTSWHVMARPIDDTGAPLGPYQSLGYEQLRLSTPTPQYRSYRYPVPEGRWEVTVERTSPAPPEKDVNRAVRDVVWQGLRGYLPSHQDYGNATMLAMVIRATNSLNNSTARRVNIVATRRLRTWDPVQGWSQGTTATRSPAWAFADACKDAEYGRGLPDSRINLPALHRLAGVWAQRGDFYDGSFDTTMGFWDALTQIARVGRAMPLYQQGIIDIIRDEPKSVRTQMFTPGNMVAQSFSVDYAYPEFDKPDHIIVEFINDVTWQPDEVECALPGSLKHRPFRVQMPGITSRDQAWREGMTMCARDRDQRRFVTLQTEFEGGIPGYGDLVEVSHDVPKWGLSGYVEDFDPESRTLTTSEPLEWWPGENHYIAVRRRDGSPDGPYRVVAAGPVPAPEGLSPAELADLQARRVRILDLANPYALYISNGSVDEFTHYTFGPGERRALLAQLMSAIPDEEMRWSLDLVNYAESVHQAELGGDVPPPPAPSLLPDPAAAPIVDNVTVYAAIEPGTQMASASPARGALRYEFEGSSDMGVTWQVLGEQAEPSLLVRLAAGPWRVRVRGVGALTGPWTTWTGVVSANAAPPPALTSLTATGQVMAIDLRWTWESGPWLRSVEIWISETPNLSDAQLMGEYRLPLSRFTLYGLAHGKKLYFWGRIRDEADQPGPWYPQGPGVVGESSSDAGPILDLILDHVVSSEQGQTLFAGLERINLAVLALRADAGAADGALQALTKEGKQQRAALLAETAARAEQVGRVADELVQTGTDLAAEVQARISGQQGLAAGLSAEGAARTQQLNLLRGQINERLNAVDGELAGILGTEDYDAARAYAQGNLVSFNDKLYRARQAVPVNTPPVAGGDTAYWALIGDYTSLGAAVGDLASRMTSAELVQEDQASRMGSLESEAEGLASNVQSLQQTTAGQAQAMQGLGTRLGEAENTAQTALTTSTQAAQSVNNLSSTVGGLGTQIEGLDQTTTQLAMSAQAIKATAEGAASGVEQVRTAQAGQADQLVTLRTDVDGVSSLAQTLQQTSDEQASSLDTLRFDVDGTKSDVSQLFEVSEGLASRADTLDVSVGGLRNSVTDLARASEQFALTLLELRATAGDADASLTTMRRVQADTVEQVTRLVLRADGAVLQITDLMRIQDGQAQRLVEMQVEADGLQSRTVTLEEAAEGFASRFQEVETDIEGMSSSVQSLSQAQEGLATQLGLVSATAAGAAAGVEAEATARVAGDQALAQELVMLSASVEDQGASIGLLDQVTQDQALRHLEMMAEAGANEGFITQQMRLSATHGQQISQLAVQGDGFLAAIQAAQQALIDQEQALASAVQILQTGIGDAEALAEIAMESVTTLDGKVTSTINLKTEVVLEGHRVITGLQIGSAGEGGEAEGSVLVYAQRFGIVDEASGQLALPFVVQNGQMVVADAVIGQLSGEKIRANTLDANALTATSFNARLANLDQAYIRTGNLVDLAVKTGKIDNLAVGTLKIADNSVTINTVESADLTFWRDSWGELQGTYMHTAMITLPAPGYVTAFVDWSWRVPFSAPESYNMPSLYWVESNIGWSGDTGPETVRPPFGNWLARSQRFFSSGLLPAGTHWVIARFSTTSIGANTLHYTRARLSLFASMK